MKFQKWMDTKIIEFDGQQFKAEQLLRDMSNKEGAHIEENHSLLVPHDLNMDPDRNTLHRLANGIRFGTMTYLQIFALYTGLYLVNRTRAILSNLTFPAGNEAVEYICETIKACPRSISTNNSDIEFTSYPLAVLGHDRLLRGDYSSGISSTVKAPDCSRNEVGSRWHSEMRGVDARLGGPAGSPPEDWVVVRQRWGICGSDAGLWALDGEARSGLG